MIYVFYKSRDLMGVKEGLWSANQPCEVDGCVCVWEEMYVSYLYLRRLQLLIHFQGVVMEPDLHKHLRKIKTHILRIND